MKKILGEEPLEPDDPPTEMLASPLASSSSGADVVAEALLALTGEVVKLSVLLLEADEDEMRLVGPRLKLFQTVVASLNTTPRPRRRMGFGVPKVKRRKGPVKSPVRRKRLRRKG